MPDVSGEILFDNQDVMESRRAEANELMQILVADDEPKVLSALCLLLEQQPDVEVVAEVCDVPSLLDVARALQPDLLLVDYELAGLRPQTEFLARLRALCPDVRIIALSGRPEVARQAMAAGVDGLVSTTDSPQRVLAVVDGVGRGPRGRGPEPA
jgi:DNA-binding NarL/FixJ family response regulator